MTQISYYGPRPRRGIGRKNRKYPDLRPGYGIPSGAAVALALERLAQFELHSSGSLLTRIRPPATAPAWTSSLLNELDCRAGVANKGTPAPVQRLGEPRAHELQAVKPFS